MSYILDALRRAESERARETVPGLHEPQAALAPLHEREAPARAPWLWMAAGAALVLLAGLAWSLLARTPAPASATPAAAAQPAAPVAQPAAPRVLAPPPPAVAASAPLAVAPAPSLAPPAARVVAAPPPVEAPRPVSVETSPVPSPTPAPAPAQASAEDAPAPTLAQLPDDLRRALPPLRFEGTVYSEVPANRMLMVNGQLLHEGEAIGHDLTVERIKPKTAVLRFRGQRFELTR
ncbi:hypothetical protein GCM10025771_06550 [Niveibacterium umoris]|uniref:General secretion pathway protein B n=1 Tax=Niveibacterium umoris TaxID=1193620 RepID=A0A840BQJ3_9RHOO|nr:general secretion pathway protein GspB [Niveibacterium umoris]MBB4013798.1 general secretion pathway protein B [Niveibacterium umoris]